MEDYLIKTNVALMLFYLMYRFVLYNHSSHQVKRFSGMGILLFCSILFLLPSIPIPSSPTYPTALNDLMQNVAAVESTFQTDVPSQGMSYLILLFLAGVFLFSIRFLAGLLGVFRLYRKSAISHKWGFTLVETGQKISPFSFFHLLFIHKGEAKKPELQPIVLHEQYHRDQFHSLDVLLLELLAIFYWFNPFIWLLKRDIKASHEFMADEYVLSKGHDKLNYQDLLFQARTGISFTTANYLSDQTSLKQRFTTMEQKKTRSKNSYMRVGIVLAAMACAVALTSFTTVQNVTIGPGFAINVYTNDGIVDLDEGIAQNTDQLYVRIVPFEGDKLSYRISKIEATLVAEGMGIGSLISKEIVPAQTLLSGAPRDKKCLLLLAVQEYQTKTSDDIVENVVLEKPFFIKLPVY